MGERGRERKRERERRRERELRREREGQRANNKLCVVVVLFGCLLI